MFQVIRAVVAFELRRAIRPGRLVAGLIPVIFPVALLVLADRLAPNGPSTDRTTLLAFILIPQLLCLLTHLRSTVPMIQSEIEAQSWIYLSLRSQGKHGLVLGKYVASVMLSAAGGLLATMATALLVVPPSDWSAFLSTIGGLVILASGAYGALYCLIGVFFIKRGMVFAFGYTLIVEFIVSFLPATANQFTVSYHLRSLLVEWSPLAIQGDVPWLGTESTTAHIAKLVIFSGLALATALTVIRFRELPLQGETAGQ